MERKRFEEIMSDDSLLSGKDDYQGDRALRGLNIIAKYLPADSNILEGADHDIIYSVDVDALLEAGFTEADAIELRKLNWMVDELSESLAHYV